MISWKKDLYLGAGTRKEHKKILSKIRRHEFQLGVYVITLANNGKDIFDIIPAFMLSKDGFHGKSICILGLASSKDEAVNLAADMILDVNKKTGGFDVRGYFA